MDKRKIIFLVSVLVIGGGVAFYLYNDKKKKKSLALTPIDATPIGATSTPLKPFVLKKAPVYRTEHDAKMKIATGETVNRVQIQPKIANNSISRRADTFAV
jgi:hypothetical protein